MSALPTYSNPFSDYGVQQSPASAQIGRRKRQLNIPPAPPGVSIGAAQSFQPRVTAQIPPPPIGDYRNAEVFNGMVVPRALANNTRAQQGMDQNRELDAQQAADFAEAAPMPQTQEGYARRRAFINRQRARVAQINPAPPDVIVTGRGVAQVPSGSAIIGTGGATTNARPQPISQAEADLVNTGKIKPEDIQSLRTGAAGATPAGDAATTAAGPYDSPTGGANLPRESQVAKDNAAAAAESKKSFPITVQHAKAMWDNIAAAGVDVEGYNPIPIFQRLMGEYGVHPERAAGLAHSFTALAQGTPNPTGYLNPAQKDQVMQSRDPAAAAQQTNPFRPGNVLPGNNQLTKSDGGNGAASSAAPASGGQKYQVGQTIQTPKGHFRVTGFASDGEPLVVPAQ